MSEEKLEHVCKKIKDYVKDSKKDDAEEIKAYIESIKVLH